jgi:hypothetical protein
MARITPNHYAGVRDPRAEVLSRFGPNPRGVIATASQVGRGVRIDIPESLTVDRQGWEAIKIAVELAFKDDEEVPCENPIW